MSLHLTRDNFAKLKNDIDTYFSRFTKSVQKNSTGITRTDISGSPEIYPVDLDKYYAGRIRKLAATFYDGIGLNVDAYLQKATFMKTREKPACILYRY